MSPLHFRPLATSYMGVLRIFKGTEQPHHIWGTQVPHTFHVVTVLQMGPMHSVMSFHSGNRQKSAH